MSLFSQLLGSFERTGNYPIEANYIFPTVSALEEFYSDEVNNATLHKGLLKIVEDNGDGQQALFWVTKKQTSDDLEFTQLIVANSINEILAAIDDLEQKLEQEIADRKQADTAIWGTEEPELIDDLLNSILKLSEALIEFKSQYEEFKTQTENALDNLLTICKAIAGSEIDDVVTYLSGLPYENLTVIARLLDHFFNPDPENDSINTWPELVEFLKDYKDTDTLLDILTTLSDNLWNKIEGDPLPNEPFRTLRGVQDFVETLASVTKNRLDNLQTELDLTQVGVGLSGDGAYNADQETHYLKLATSVMNALKILDSLINEAINNCNLEVEDSNTVDLKIDKYLNRTVLSANVLVSRENGNGIIAKSDGIYHKVESEYNNGVLTLKVNGNIVSQHVLGLSYIGVDRAYYDPTTESIVMVFTKEDRTTEELRIPVTLLIREWTTDNSGVNDVVVLTRIEDYAGGPDKLSADVRLFDDRYNILTKQGNSLYVKGTADNIVWNDVKVSILLDNLATRLDEISQLISDNRSEIIAITDALQDKLDREIVRAKQAELELNTEFQASQSVQDSKIEDLRTQTNSNSTAILLVKDELEEEIVRATTEEVKNHELIVLEKARAETKENQLEDDIEVLRNRQTEFATNLLNEISRATTKESTLESNLNDEILRAKAKETQIETDLIGEVARAQTAEQTLTEKVFNLQNELVRAIDKSDRAVEKVTELEAQCTALDLKIESETGRAEAQEAIIAHSVEDERNRALLVEYSLKEKVDLYAQHYDDIKDRVDDLEERSTDVEDLIRELDERKADKSMLLWYYE